MSELSFGLWTYYYQFLLIINALIITPNLLFYNRDFHSKDKIQIKNFGLNLFVISFGFLLLYFVRPEKTINLTYCFMVVLSLVINLIIFNHLRFNNNNHEYLVFSLLRFLVFITSLSFFSYVNSSLGVDQLMISLIISNMPVIIYYFTKIQITNKNHQPNEYIKLALYGALTIAFGSLEKLILLDFGFSVFQLAVIGYSLTFVTSTNLILEGFKKYFSPIFFNDFNSVGFYRRKTIKNVIKVIILLTFIQITLPFLLYYFIDYLDLLNKNLVKDGFLELILLFSISFSINNIYHFLNPFVFYKNKSQILMTTILIVGLLFICLMFFNSDLINIAYSKIICSVVLVLTTAVLLNKLDKGIYVR